jgi:hypothetical protein
MGGGHPIPWNRPLGKPWWMGISMNFVIGTIYIHLCGI